MNEGWIKVENFINEDLSTVTLWLYFTEDDIED